MADRPTDPPEGNPRQGVTFETPDDGPGLRIHDRIDRHQFDLYTPEAVSPDSRDTDQFLGPVDVAATISTARLAYENVLAMYIREADGSLVAEAEHGIEERFPEATYVVELEPPIKVYLRVESEMAIATEGQRTTIDFGAETEVAIGARSHQDHPPGTVTTTDDPRDVMAAIATVGSALKTTSPERSYPTMRGHPPLIELGDELDIPAGLEPPDNGVHLELPADLEMLYTAAPLAYYLGADIREAETPALVTDDGFVHPLDADLDFQTGVERTLKQVFFMDCVTRTEGHYTVDLHERHEIEGALDIDFADLYERPLGEQLETYLEVPYETIADQIPDWKLTTHVAPDPAGVETLPFALNELAIVRPQARAEVSTPADQAAAIQGFVRDGDMTRSASAEGGADLDTVVQPEETDTLGQAWIGEGAPVGASKASVDAFKNRLSREPTAGDISIAVVRNDPEMEAERVGVESVYGSREHLPFDVSMHTDLTTAELAELLGENLDFLHYIGHVDDDGFECADGKLDVRDVEAVNVDSFFLNACQSYEQGMALIERGAIGGVVTLREVLNSGAVKVGKTLARLLNLGFPLRPALDLAKGESVIGEQYIVVGDGELAIAQSEGGTPVFAAVEPAGDMYDLELHAYPTTQRGMGSTVMPMLGDGYRHYLNSGAVDTFTLTRTELETFLLLEEAPIVIDGEVHWSTDIDLADLE